MELIGTLQAIAFLAGLLLCFVFALSGLAAFSRLRAAEAEAEEAIWSREGICLVCLNFALILALLIWRAG